jgi:xanthine dehydrogenase accessory factor
MNCWRALPDLLAHEDVVLVSVAQTRGSAPREAGTHMLVSMTQTVDTIGGGHLEWEAMAHARAMLLQPAGPSLLKLSLGASLGQCCGGVVWLVFERIAQSARDAWSDRRAAIDAGVMLRRELCGRRMGSDDVAKVGDNPPFALHSYVIHEPVGCFANPPYTSSLWHTCSPDEAQRNPGTTLHNDGPVWHLSHHIAHPTFKVTVCGAGHVGAAIIQVLATLDAQIRWVDVRDDLFGSPPANVTCIATDAPQDEVDNAAPDTFFLVLTHSHTLDLELSARILRRDAFAWFGLIGSRTKRARFEHRLQAQGISAVQMARMICPIGVPGISDKSPQAIAIAVVAQLLQAKEQYASQQRELVPDDAYDER